LKFKTLAQKTGDFMLKIQTTLQVMRHEACSLQKLYHHSLWWVRPEWLIRYRIEFSQEPLGKEEQRAAREEESTVVILRSVIASSWLVDGYLY
jgi:hypothetical protein